VNCALVSGITREYTIRYCPILLCCHLANSSPSPVFQMSWPPGFSPDFPHFAYICLAALLLTTSITCANKLQQTFAQNSSLECPQPTWLSPIPFSITPFSFSFSAAFVCVCGVVLEFLCKCPCHIWGIYLKIHDGVLKCGVYGSGSYNITHNKQPEMEL